jgi:hypothetical protein
MSDALRWESDKMDTRSIVPERNAYLTYILYKKLLGRRRWKQSYGRRFIVSGVENITLHDPRIALS